MDPELRAALDAVNAADAVLKKAAEDVNAMLATFGNLLATRAAAAAKAASAKAAG